MQLFFVANREQTQMPEWTFELRRGLGGLNILLWMQGSNKNKFFSSFTLCGKVRVLIADLRFPPEQVLNTF